MSACLLVFAVLATSLTLDAMAHTSNTRQGRFS
jgi:hypothetical protein